MKKFNKTIFTLLVAFLIIGCLNAVKAQAASEDEQITFTSDTFYGDVDGDGKRDSIYLQMFETEENDEGNEFMGYSMVAYINGKRTKIDHGRSMGYTSDDYATDKGGFYLSEFVYEFFGEWCDWKNNGNCVYVDGVTEATFAAQNIYNVSDKKDEVTIKLLYGPDADPTGIPASHTIIMSYTGKSLKVLAVMYNLTEKQDNTNEYYNTYGHLWTDESKLGIIAFEGRSVMAIEGCTDSQYKGDWTAKTTEFTKGYKFKANVDFNVYKKSDGKKKAGTVKQGQKFKVSKIRIKSIWKEEEVIKDTNNDGFYDIYDPSECYNVTVWKGYEHWAYVTTTDKKVKGWVNIDGETYEKQERWIDSKHTASYGYNVIPTLVANPYEGGADFKKSNDMIKKVDTATGKTYWEYSYKTVRYYDD